MKNKVDTFGAPVFASDYSATVLAAKICINSHEHSMYIIFLWQNKTSSNTPSPLKLEPLYFGSSEASPLNPDQLEGLSSVDPCKVGKSVV
jgi:hypothetical protein